MDKFLKMKIVNNIKVKEKEYEINKIKESFIRQSLGYRVSEYHCSEGIGQSQFYTKLCYEAVRAIDERWDEVKGLAFLVNSQIPSYVSYTGIMERSSGGLAIMNDSNIIKTAIVSSSQEYAYHEIDPMKYLSEFIGKFNRPAGNIDEVIGRIVRGGSSTYLTNNGLKINIPSSCIMAGVSKHRCQADDVTLTDIYMSISSEIMSSRNRTKDLSWFMYKVYMLNSLMEDLL